MLENWRRAALPIVMLTVGVWLFHSGEFAKLLLLRTVPSGETTLH